MFVQSDHFAVDHGILGPDPSSGPSQVREVGRGVLAVACPDARVPVVDDGLHPIPVPLDLEEPIRRVERGVDGRRQHGGNELGSRRSTSAGKLLRAYGSGRRREEARRQILGDLLVGAAGAYARRMRLRIPARHSVVVALVEQKPAVAIGLASVGITPAAGADEREAAAELLAEELELQLTSRQRGSRIIGLFRLVGAPVPDDRVAATVLTLGNHTLELEVFDGVVLRPLSEAPGRGIERWPARDRPAGEHTVHLQAKVVVQPGCPMAPDDETPRSLPYLASRRLWGLAEVSLLAIRLEWHEGMVSPTRGHGSCADWAEGREIGGGRLA